MEKNASEFLAEVSDYLDHVHDKEASSRLGQIIAEQTRRDFRVCIAGGFSRGKTHLVNHLLETDIFPEMALPTTSILTKIEYGERLSLVREWQGERHEYSDVAATLSRFSTSGDLADANGILRVSFPHPLLASGLCLYDTPGIDDVLESRATLTFNALEHCDAALVVVSAVSPLSLMEKSFIETYIYKRSIPRIALVLTFLDKIPEEKRLPQLDYIRSKVHAVCPAMELWCTTELEPSMAAGFQISGIPAIRERLVQWPGLPDIKALNDRRTLYLLKELVEKTLIRQQDVLENLQQDKSVRQEELTRALDALDEKSDIWHRLRDDFLNRGERTAGEAQEGAARCCRMLTKELRREPGEDFEAKLRERLRESASEISSQIAERIKQDMSILNQMLTGQLGLTTGCALFNENLSIADKIFDIPSYKDTDSVLEILLQYTFDIIEKASEFLPIPPQAKKIVDAIVKYIEENKSLWISEKKLNKKQKYFDFVISQFQNILEQQLWISVNRIYYTTAEEIRQKHRQWLQQQKDMLWKHTDLTSLQQKIAVSARNIERGRKLLDELSEARS